MSGEDPLVLIATIKSVEGQSGNLHTALRDLIAPTRAEAGCERYELYRHDAIEGCFVLIETWVTRTDWQAHMAAPHIAAFRSRTEGVIAEFGIEELSIR